MGMVSLRAKVEQRILVLLHAAGFLRKQWRRASLVH